MHIITPIFSSEPFKGKAIILLGLFPFSLRLKKMSVNMPCPSSLETDAVRFPFAVKQLICVCHPFDHGAAFAGSKRNLRVLGRGEIPELGLEHLRGKSI